MHFIVPNQGRRNVFEDTWDKKSFVLNLVGTIFKNRTFLRLCSKIWLGHVPLSPYVPAPLLIEENIFVYIYSYQKCGHRIDRNSEFVNANKFLCNNIMHIKRHHWKIRRNSQLNSYHSQELQYFKTKIFLSDSFWTK